MPIGRIADYPALAIGLATLGFETNKFGVAADLTGGLPGPALFTNGHNGSHATYIRPCGVSVQCTRGQT